MYQWRIISIQLLLVPFLVVALETPVPERFLAPRNFNPHPITDVKRPGPKYKRLNIPEPADVYARYLQHREPAYKGQEYLQYASEEQQQLTQAKYEEHQQQHQSNFARSDHYSPPQQDQDIYGTAAPQQHTYATAQQHTYATLSPHEHNYEAAAINEAYSQQYSANNVDHYDSHQYVTAAPPQQYVTATPVHQYVTATPPQQYVTAIPTPAHHYVTVAPAHAHQFAKPIPLAHQYPTPTPAQVHHQFVTPTPHQAPQAQFGAYDRNHGKQLPGQTFDERVPKKYAFSYAVLDHHSGDDFSHAQKHDGHSTEGQYRVKLPDGRVQVVKYTADNQGYRAKVSYEVDVENNKDTVIVNPTPAPSYYKHQHHVEDNIASYAASAADHQYITTTYPSIDRHLYKNHYTQQQFRSTTPYPEYNTVTNAPPTFYNQHHPDLTVATTYPSVTRNHHHRHYGGHDNEPRVHVEYNGASNEGHTIEQSHQVYEQHQVYKRDKN